MEYLGLGEHEAPSGLNTEFQGWGEHGAPTMYLRDVGRVARWWRDASVATKHLAHALGRRNATLSGPRLH